MRAAGRGQGHAARGFLAADPFVVEGVDVADGARLVHELPAVEVTHVE
jgi:hypothetical protein